MEEKTREKRRVDPADWLSRIESYDRSFSGWKRRAKEIIDIFRLHSSGASTSSARKSGSYNILWANTKILLPALFSKTPQVVAERRNRDDDRIGRLASMVLERSANTEIETNGMSDAMEAVVLDVLLCGRGVSWILFDFDPLPPEPVVPAPPPPMPEPVIGPDGVPMPAEPPPDLPPAWMTQDGEPVDPAEVVEIDGAPMIQRDGVTNERTTIDYVNWADFAHSPARSWHEVEKDGWVARRIAMSRKEGMQRFGEGFGKVQLTLSSRLDHGDSPEHARESPSLSGEEPRFAEVWEIWDASTRRRIHVAKGIDDPLEVEDDPYGLEGFFPCPRPTFATLSNEDLVPISDFEQYQPLAEELEILTRRRMSLARVMKLCGIYDDSVEGVGQMMEGKDGTLIPVKGMSGVDGRGGIDNVIQWAPVEAAHKVLDGLNMASDRVQQSIYEISGVSDIMKGNVDPREKASQSRIKSQYASQRLDQQRRSIERHARDVSRIMVEVMAELYSAETLREQSGFDLFPEVQQIGQDPQAGPQAVEQTWEQVIQLIRDERTRGFRIDIETDSTIALSAEIEGEKRNQATAAMGGFMANILPAINLAPELLPAIGQLMLFTLRGHRAGRQVEAAFEKSVEMLFQRLMAQQQAAQQQEEQGPPPDPVAEAQAAKIQQQAEIEGQKGQLALQQAQMEAEAAAQQQQIEAQAAQQKAAADAAAGEQAAAAADMKGKMDVLAKVQGMQQKQQAADAKKEG